MVKLEFQQNEGCSILENFRVFVVYPDNEFAEQRISPGKPRTCVIRWIILVEGFMHEPFSGMSGAQGMQAGGNLSGIPAGEGLHDQRHRPYLAAQCMRTSYPAGCLAGEEVRIIGT